ncbi:MAG: hypothetical protein JSV78_00415, partial [Phycisphaerales bacterium]
MLAFVHIEKAAGTTVNHILARSFGLRHADVMAWRCRFADLRAADLRGFRRMIPGLVSIAGHIVKPFNDLHLDCPSIRYWTILREPLARCASHYQYQVNFLNIPHSFEEWIADPRFQNFQTRKLAGVPDADAAIGIIKDRFVLVGLLEHFHESLLLLRAKLHDPRLD